MKHLSEFISQSLYETKVEILYETPLNTPGAWDASLSDGTHVRLIADSGKKEEVRIIKMKGKYLVIPKNSFKSKFDFNGTHEFDTIASAKSAVLRRYKEENNTK